MDGLGDLTRRDFLGVSFAALVRSEKSRKAFPEYERTLEKALVCFPDASGDTDPETLSRFLEAAYRDLSSVLPSYTRVHVAARRDAGSFPGSSIHLVGDSALEIEIWAQDIGEPVLVDGTERFLVARRMPPSMGAASKMSRDRKRVAEIVFGEASVVEAPFVFEGGNLAFDRNRVLIGTNDVSRTLAASGDGRSRSQVLEEVATTFGAAEAFVMGEEPQSPLLQHIDQAFVVLEDRAAVVGRLEGGGLDMEARQLRHYASQLKDLGYRVSFLDHAASDLSAYRSSINVVPFFDREAGKRVLLPVYPGEVRDDARSVDRAKLIGKAAWAFDLYRDLGYQPTPVRDVTHSLGGNTHCILNVLS
jgi:hypothetical protein